MGISIARFGFILTVVLGGGACLTVGPPPFRAGAQDKQKTDATKPVANIQCEESGKYIGGIDRSWKLSISGPKDKKWEYSFTSQIKSSDITATGTYELVEDLAVFTGKINQEDCCFSLNYGFPGGKVEFNGFFAASDQELRLHRKWFRKVTGAWQPTEEVVLTIPRDLPKGEEWTLKVRGERTRWDKGLAMRDKVEKALVYIKLNEGDAPSYSLKSPAEDWLPSVLQPKVADGRLEAVLWPAVGVMGTARGFNPRLVQVPGPR
jgi:hypothetical protein